MCCIGAACVLYRGNMCGVVWCIGATCVVWNRDSMCGMEHVWCIRAACVVWNMCGV